MKIVAFLSIIAAVVFFAGLSQSGHTTQTGHALLVAQGGREAQCDAGRQKINGNPTPCSID